MKNKKVWLVTGASKGLGLSLVNQLLQQGHAVAATSRSKKALTEAVGQESENFLPLQMDIVSESSVQLGVQKALGHFGHIDVVVNNAGYGLLGSLEELTDAEARADFDVNVFGALNIIRAVTPHLRQRRSGHVINISSIGGLTGDFPGWGIYCATKFALNGLTESFAAEVKDFNIKTTIVLPGYFKTSFLTSDSLVTPQKPIAEYKAVRESQDFHQTTMDGNQQGDPDKAATVMIGIANEENPPLYLFLGSDAYDMAQRKIAKLQNELEAWKEETLSTSYAVPA